MVGKNARYVCRRTEESADGVINHDYDNWQASGYMAVVLFNPQGLIMNNKLTASVLVAGLFLLPVTGHTADAEKSSATEYVKDSVITTKIKAELAAEKMSSLVKINVDTDKHGMVLLTGSAASQTAVDKAVSIAKGVKGVTSVKNEIKVVADK